VHDQFVPRGQKLLSDTTFSDLPQDDYALAWYASRPRRRFDAQALLLLVTLAGIGAMAWSYFSALKPITLEVNQHPVTVLTNQNTVAGVLNDAGMQLAPQDIVFPALDSPIPDNQPITVQLARPVEIQADGDAITVRTQGKTITDALRDANIMLKPQDRVLIGGAVVAPSAALPDAADEDPSTLDMVVQRAVPIEVNDNGALTTFYTTAPTLGEALRQAGLVVYLGDAITPDLGTPVSPGWQVYIRRSRAATIQVDGKTVRTRTLGHTVADLIAQEGIHLAGKDYTIPAATEAVSDGMDVRVMRVKEDFVTVSEPIPFDTKWQPDPNLELDVHQVTQAGVEGTKKRTIRITYENGHETSRTIDKEWIEAAPVTKIIHYGTDIVDRPLTLPDGSTMTYWRKVRVLATSYTAATSGKARTHPEYGITALGLHAGLGIVAVDPKVINLRAKMYVPGYGLATAGDTGGRIKGRRVDLGYDESDLVLWFKWVDVYLLDPPPPANQINWIIPELPSNNQ
jgi:resuscitation-promoting factor RpfB